MLVAACLLFFLGTMVCPLVHSMMFRTVYLNSQHVIVDANHVWQGFISSGGADQFFDDVSKNTLKNAIYELETLVGDTILVSSVRCSYLTRSQLGHVRSTDAMSYGRELR